MRSVAVGRAISHTCLRPSIVTFLSSKTSCTCPLNARLINRIGAATVFPSATEKYSTPPLPLKPTLRLKFDTSYRASSYNFPCATMAPESN